MNDVQFNFKFKGWMAVPVLLLVIGFFAYKFFAIKSTLASEATQELKLQLQGEYTSIGLKGIDIQKLDRHRVDPRVQKLLDASKVEFVSVSSKGTDPVYIRVEIRVNGNEPPDGKPVRYYKMKYSTLTGWRVLREVSWWSYYSRLF